jgi:hypothetical protein
MVRRGRQDNEKPPAKQGRISPTPEPNRIAASTPFDFTATHLTPYGGLLPVATMLERLGFQTLIEQTLTVSRVTRVMGVYQFVLAIVLGLYIGFARLNQLRFVARDPLLTGILRIAQVPPQSTLWRFLDSLHGQIARQILTVQAALRQRVWTASHIVVKAVTLDTDTTVHTVYGKKMGARVSYNPQHKGKKSYQPILTFVADTREYLWGDLHNGDKPTGKQIATHLRHAFAALPPGTRPGQGRADSGFYCWEAVAAYEAVGCQFVIVARKTNPLIARLTAATWVPSPGTDADAQCQFDYQPQGWPRPYRFIALRYEVPPDTPPEPVEQYQLFATAAYTYRVFVTNFTNPIDKVVWFYNRRAGAENLIKEANNDAGLAAHPSHRFDVNSIHFQLAMLAYNLNCWLLLFQRHETVTAVETLRHTTLATARPKFLFVAAKVWRHARRTGVSYSADYPEQPVFNRLMDRLRRVTPPFGPVLDFALT